MSNIDGHALDAIVRGLVREVMMTEVLPALRNEIRAVLGTMTTSGRPDDRNLNTSEAAAVAGVKPTTIRSWIEEGKLPAHRGPGGREWRVKQCDLARLLGGEGGVGTGPVSTEAAAARMLSLYAGKMTKGGT